MDMYIDKKIPRMQISMSTLRKVAGWSAEELANMLDVTRQSIANLESRRVKMTKIQYIAFRSVFEEAKLGAILTAMIDDDKITDEDRKYAKKCVDDAVNGKRRCGSKATALIARGAAFAALNLGMPR